MVCQKFFLKFFIGVKMDWDALLRNFYTITHFPSEYCAFKAYRVYQYIFYKRVQFCKARLGVVPKIIVVNGLLKAKVWG